MQGYTYLAAAITGGAELELVGEIPAGGTRPAASRSPEGRIG
jgi:hypothetical protein